VRDEPPNPHMQCRGRPSLPKVTGVMRSPVRGPAAAFGRPCPCVRDSGCCCGWTQLTGSAAPRAGSPHSCARVLCVCVCTASLNTRARSRAAARSNAPSIADLPVIKRLCALLVPRACAHAEPCRSLGQGLLPDEGGRAARHHRAGHRLVVVLGHAHAQLEGRGGREEQPVRSGAATPEG
jgi:hypothetical protein